MLIDCIFLKKYFNAILLGHVEFYKKMLGTKIGIQMTEYKNVTNYYVSFFF